ncbi:MAG: tripartite tricarboxylate transporter substrate-binding protein [Xanthobacteraceae bacterium]
MGKRLMGRFFAIAAVAVLALAGTAAAQIYPSRVVTMVVPFPAGGGTTLLARVVAEQMTAELGQTVIVENAPGAGGTIGVAKVARAAPDGYTLLFGNWASNVGSGAVYPVDYDLLKDFAPIARIADAPLWLVARKDFPTKDLKEALAWLKANPGKATWATVGVGSASHLCGIYLEHETGIRVQFIPYHGGAPAIQDLIGGHVDMMCDFSANSLPFYRAGQIKALGVMARHRWSGAPQVPTFEETGVTGLYVSFWHGLWAPKGTPTPIIAKLNAAIVKTLADPTVRKRFAAQGQELPPPDQLTPQALAAYQKAEIEKWWPIIKAAGVKAQ